MLTPERIAIYGASYGGYATLAGLASHQTYMLVELIMLSLFTFIETIRLIGNYIDKCFMMVGHPEDDKVLLTESSIKVEKIKSPYL